MRLQKIFDLLDDGGLAKKIEMPQFLIAATDAHCAMATSTSELIERVLKVSLATISTTGWD